MNRSCQILPLPFRIMYFFFFLQTDRFLQCIGHNINSKKIVYLASESTRGLIPTASLSKKKQQQQQKEGYIDFAHQKPHQVFFNPHEF